MSVISRNPFDLLGEDGSETPSVKAPTPAAAKPAAAAAKPAAREVPGSKASAPRGGAAGRGGNYAPRGGPRNVLKAAGGDDSAAAASDPEAGFEGERRAPRGDKGARADRGRGAPRAPRGAPRAPRAGGAGAGAGAGAAGAPRREYHNGRKSLDAHTDSEKKVNQGWGAEEGTAELAAEIAGEADASKEAAAPQTPANELAEPTDEEKKAAAPVEEEDNTKSYDEYLAERAAIIAGLNKLEVREVTDAKDIVGQEFARSEEPDEAFFAGKQSKKAAAPEKTKSSKKEKVFIEIEGKFAPPAGSDRAERGERGERGAARGGDRAGRGRGAPRGDRGAARGGDRPRGAPRGAPRGGFAGKKEAPIAVNDASAFPALGA